MIDNVFLFVSLFTMVVRMQFSQDWKLFDSECFSIEVPSDWVFQFGSEDEKNPNKRNIKVKNDKGERVEYELGTLCLGNGTTDFSKLMDVEVRSFRKISGESALLDEVGGKVPEASWPEWFEVVRKESGGSKGTNWSKYLLKGESKGFSVETGSFSQMVWKYKFFLEANGMVYVVTVSISDGLRSSSRKYDEMADRIIDSFRAK